LPTREAHESRQPLLHPLASVPHTDPRAPQNLVPIGGLERELRHRLGDQHILYRALRAAAMPVRLSALRRQTTVPSATNTS
jgi:hypothetical protein